VVHCGVCCRSRRIQLRKLANKVRTVKELFAFFSVRSWWFIPVIVLLLGAGLLAVFVESSAIAPFIYTLF
jgi:hypothetical protein